MTNTITFELGPVSLAKLDELLAALKGAAVPADKDLGSVPPWMVNPADEHPVTEPLASEAPVTVQEEQTSAVTVDDIRLVVQRLIAPSSSKREEAKAIVKSYAAKVGDIPADKCAEVLAKLQALEA